MGGASKRSCADRSLKHESIDLVSFLDAGLTNIRLLLANRIRRLNVVGYIIENWAFLASDTFAAELFCCIISPFGSDASMLFGQAKHRSGSSNGHPYGCAG